MKKTILLADDSTTIRKVVELTFGGTDFHVECVASGNEALEMLEELRPDVVLADVVMPEPSGYELCRRIKTSARPVPVLLLAGTFENFDHDEARACRADGCLLKPFEPRTLLDRVTSLIASREALSRDALEPQCAEETEERPGQVEDGETVTPTAVRDESDAGVDLAAAESSLPEEDLPPGWTREMLDVITRAVARRLTEDVVGRIAREVVPEVAERVVRQRIRELENDEP